MKKNLIASFVYLVLGLCVGVFYREFTKWNGFTERTTLSAGHGHLIALGMLLFLALYFGLKNDEVLKGWKFKTFFIAYNIGLPGTVMMMIVRGILQVEKVTLSAGIDGMVSGIAGVFHLTLGVALIFLFLALFERQKKLEITEK